MDLLLLLKGLAIGFGMAVPIGPVGVLCIRKTLADGHTRGYIIGIGGATADALFASIAAFGISFISNAIATQEIWFHVAGGALLVFLGIRTYRAKRKDPVLPFENKGYVGVYLSAVVLAITNPVTTVAFMALFAAFGLNSGLTIFRASTLVAGVFLGSTLWFMTLSFIATSFRKKLSSGGGLVWVNMFAGMLIIVSGFAAFVTIL